MLLSADLHNGSPCSPALPGGKQTLLSGWLNDYHDALNEDLSRILLGEPAPLRAEAAPRTAGLEHFLWQTRSLVEELAQLTRRLEGNGDLDQALTGRRPTISEAQRIRAIALTLQELLEPRSRQVPCAAQ